MLVLIGATPEGRKELLGFWKALDEVSPATRHQRCTLHKTVNVLDKLPKSVQPAAKAGLREVWNAPDRATAEAAVAMFAGKYGAKYEKALACLVKDQDTLLTFYDFLAEHWDLGRNAWRAHLRTSNPIGSVFATVRHRTVRTKGALSQNTARLMVFKLVMTGGQNLAPAEGQDPVAQSRPGRHIPQRRRGHQHASTERRPTTASLGSDIAPQAAGRGKGPEQGRRASTWTWRPCASGACRWTARRWPSRSTRRCRPRRSRR